MSTEQLVRQGCCQIRKLRRRNREVRSLLDEMRVTDDYARFMPGASSEGRVVLGPGGFGTYMNPMGRFKRSVASLKNVEPPKNDRVVNAIIDSLVDSLDDDDGIPEGMPAPGSGRGAP